MEKIMKKIVKIHFGIYTFYRNRISKIIRITPNSKYFGNNFHAHKFTITLLLTKVYNTLGVPTWP